MPDKDRIREREERLRREVADAEAWQAAHDEGMAEPRPAGMVGFVRRHWWVMVAILVVLVAGRLIARLFS